MTRAFIHFQAETAYGDPRRLLAIVGLFLLAVALEWAWDRFDRVIPKDR